jgi:lytic murein transglycosylase
MQTTPSALPKTALLALLSATLASCAAPPPRGAAAAAPQTTHVAIDTASAAPAADAPQPPQRRFADWIADFQRDALARGIHAATLEQAFAGVQYLPQVVERDRSQAEFTRTVWDYLDTAVSPGRIARGQDRWYEVRPLAEAAATRYGVPATILAAIWGMESNFGSNTGDIPTIDALATLGFDGRRAAWAREQLLAALRILQSGDIARERMIGSWAGAMGQTQFLPTNFLAYAVDADGDGRRDIWGSMADVLASTAHFLARAGWQAGQSWGLEVRLAPDFDVGRADADVRQSSMRWAAEGVRSMDGTALPELPDAAVFLPAGARGPAFLVGANFRVLLRYNNATSYALAVGLLAQQLAGGPGVQAPWPRDLQPLARSEILALQTALNRRGFDSGKPDGLLGPATRAGIRAFQRSAGLPADGYPTPELLQRVLQSP